MSKLYCLGELLIDFIPASTSTFKRHFGGAPANVALGTARLGGNTQFIGQVGDDAFGRFLTDTLKAGGVDTKTVLVSQKKNTPLAFVTLSETGERSFGFYRDNTADLDYNSENINDIPFERRSLLHFCSVSLVPSNIKAAHDIAIEAIRDTGGLISFDPNLRFNLWPSETLLKDTVLSYLSRVDLLKLSEEELTFITGASDEAEAIDTLNSFNLKAVLISKGEKGSAVYAGKTKVEHPGFKVTAIDTTGAGDAFMAAVLRKIQQKGIEIELYSDSDWQEILTYANAAGALTTTHKGAVSAIPNDTVITTFINNRQKNIS